MKRLLPKPFIKDSLEYKSKKSNGFFIITYFLMIIAIASSPVSSADIEKTAGDSSITIIDDWGREVTLDKHAERIAFSHTAAGEGILLADGWDKVVGREALLQIPSFIKSRHYSCSAHCLLRDLWKNANNLRLD